MQRTVRQTAAALALAVVAASCGDSVTDSTGDTLSSAEAYAIFSELQFAISDALSAQGSAAGSGPALASPITPVTGTCGGGGTVTVSGDVTDNIDSQTGFGTLTFDLVEAIDACVVQTTGTDFTVSGHPNVTVAGDLTISQGSIDGTYAMGGGFSYTADDGRAGTCGVDVSLDFSNLSVSGKVCGRNISG